MGPFSSVGKVLIGRVLILSSITFSLPDSAFAQPPPPVVETAAAVSMQMSPLMWVPGTVVSRNDADLAAEVSGRILWIAEAGTHFQKGEVVARIEPQQFELDLAEREANIGQLQSSLEFSNRQLVRLKELANQNSASERQLDEITTERNIVKHKLAAAVVAHKRSLYDLERATVEAPFSGQWVERHQHQGEFTSTGSTLGRLVDIDNKEIRARAPLSVAPFVSPAMQLKVKENNQQFEYPVRAIIQVGDELSRSFEIRLTIENKNLLVGTAVRVAMPQAQEQLRVAVPRDALVIRQEKTYVYKISDGAALRIPVSLGTAKGDFIGVDGNISQGDRIVIRGAERLRNGQVVRSM
jgi:RND family efflux transporter MFP subunit